MEILYKILFFTQPLFNPACQSQYDKHSSPGQRPMNAPAPPSSSSFPTLLPATSSLLLQLLLVQAPPAGPTGTLSGTGLLRFQAAASAQQWQVTSPPPQTSCVPSCLSSPLPPSPCMLPEPPTMRVWPLIPLQNSQIQCLEPLPAPQVSAQPGRLCPQVSGCVFCLPLWPW